MRISTRGQRLIEEVAKFVHVKRRGEFQEAVSRQLGAHSRHWVIYYDRVVLMGGGKIIDYGHTVYDMRLSMT
jgi:hypothetical protein